MIRETLQSAGYVAAFLGILVGIFALRWAIYGCPADRFGRCIEAWMVTDHLGGILIAAVLGLGVGWVGSREGES